MNERKDQDKRHRQGVASVRLTDSELAALRATAARSGTSVGSVIRMALTFVGALDVSS